ncbi:MAG: methyltransferase domain-containing protein [Lewinellaceae bacterium]|nr:methyltransferase domain-containing protein [Lewinellaceae bacterium]
MANKWNPQLYDTKHAFVYQYGESLLELLAPAPGERILDIGCGTGALTRQLSNAGAEVAGIDKSPEMIEAARAAFPGLEFHVMDAAGFQFNKPFDAIFSNATLHWVPEQEQAVQCMAAALKPGGRMVVEFGGKGNVETVIKQIRKTLQEHGYDAQAARQFWYFPSISEYSSLLERNGFEVALAQLYDRPTPLADSENGITDWINMFGGTFFEDIEAAERQSLIAEIQEALRSSCYHDGGWWADYRRIRVVARRLPIALSGNL